MQVNHGSYRIAALVLSLMAGRPAVGSAQSTASQGTIAATPYLAAAERIANWLRNAHPDSIWRDDALRTGSTIGLADGVAGVTLFLNELHASTGRAEHLTQARRGADWLLRALPAEMQRPSSALPPPSSLYYGAPGAAFVLHRIHRSTNDRRYLESSHAVVNWLRERNVRQDDSAWTTFNDVLFGNAGTALFLLHAARELNDTAALGLAIVSGQQLIRRGTRESNGLWWLFRRGAPMNLPNFSHGTAGVGFLMASLHRQTQHPQFGLAANDAARYLLSIARRDSGALAVPYGLDRAEWATRYDISWAHGSAGTARLFEHLARSGDTVWRNAARHLELTTRRGLESQLHSSSNASSNASSIEYDRRFGLTGVAEYYLDMYASSGDRAMLDRARRIADVILSRATVNGDAMHWVAPRLAFMQDAGITGAMTGLFHGAAGYGLLLLRLDAAMRQRPFTLRLPDSLE